MTTTTATFQIDAIAADELVALRAAGQDGAGNPLKPFTVDEPEAVPLRCCLRMGRVGEAAMLVSYEPPGGAGAYAERGPVFVHAQSCEGYASAHQWPPAFGDRRQVLRAYDHRGRIADALVVEPGEGEAGLGRLLADPAVAVVQSRNVLYGCFMFVARRP
jgi:hypothetical protein